MRLVLAPLLYVAFVMTAAADEMRSGARAESDDLLALYGARSPTGFLAEPCQVAGLA